MKRDKIRFEVIQRGFFEPFKDHSSEPSRVRGKNGGFGSRAKPKSNSVIILQRGSYLRFVNVFLTIGKVYTRNEERWKIWYSKWRRREMLARGYKKIDSQIGDREMKAEKASSMYETFDYSLETSNDSRVRVRVQVLFRVYEVPSFWLFIFYLTPTPFSSLPFCSSSYSTTTTTTTPRRIMPFAGSWKFQFEISKGALQCCFCGCCSVDRIVF